MQGKETEDLNPMRSRLLAWLRPHTWALLLCVGLMLVQSMATLLQPWLGGRLADRLLLGEGIARLALVLFALVCAQALLGYVVSAQLQQVSGRLLADAGAQVHAQLQALPLAWHQQRQRGDVLALMTGDLHRLSGYVSGFLVPLLPLLLTLAGALLMMFRLAPAIALAMAVLLPLLFVLIKLAGRALRPLGHASMQAWADWYASAEQGLELLPLIKSNAASNRENLQFAARCEHVYQTELRRVMLEGAISPVVQILGAGTVLLLLGTMGAAVVRDGMGTGTLVSLFLYGLVLINPISQLANVYGATQSVRGAAQRLQAALSAAPEIDTGTRSALPANTAITFTGLDFAYPERAVLFQGFNLAVEHGETIALTGTNGAGKSTLIHLLLRLLEPQAGTIAIGGVDVRDFTLTALREQIGLVSQQVLLFNASVRDNIAYGRVDADPSAIERAARAARAHDFICGLPDGYDTLVGDNGVRLSGGQKQRLALARALLKDPPILILDEATAMFDPVGELEFIEACRDVLANRTVILITHRPASLALADRIVRLDGGQVQG